MFSAVPSLSAGILMRQHAPIVGISFRVRSLLKFKSFLERNAIFSPPMTAIHGANVKLVPGADVSR